MGEFEFAVSITRPDQAVMEPVPVLMVEGTMVVSDLGSRGKCNCNELVNALCYFLVYHVRCLSVFVFTASSGRGSRTTLPIRFGKNLFAVESRLRFILYIYVPIFT